MSFSEKLAELESLSMEIAQRRHRIGTLELSRATSLARFAAGQSEPVSDALLQATDRKLLAERLDLHLAETRRDVLRLELSWMISDRNAGALLDLADMEEL